MGKVLARFCLSIAVFVMALSGGDLGRACGAETTQSAVAGPHAAVTLIKGKEFAPKGDFVVGYRFSVTSSITVMALGVFDKDADGLIKGTQPVRIGLWDSDSRPLASAELPLNTKPQDGAFYVTIKPVNLAAGSYVIAYASPEDGQRYWFSAEIKTAPEIKWESGLYCGGKELACPGSPAPGTCYFGPAMLISDGGASTAVSPQAPSLSITQPLDRAVIQRDGQNSASLPVLCTLSQPASKVEIRAVNLKTQKAVSDWTGLAPAPSPNSFSGSIRLSGGWYRMEVRAMDGQKPLATAMVDHVGVGEVFVTAGQSNSCNHGQPRQSPQDDRVSACNWESGQWRQANDPQPGAEGDGGSPWPLLGDLLARQYDVPIGFTSVGVGATSVEQWLPGTDLYRRIRTALARMGPHGVRAVLWHQGESDSLEGTPAEEYARALGLIIARSRRDAGFEVPWGVALASYHPSSPATPQTQAQVVAGQQRVIQTETGLFAGLETDGFHLRDFMADGVHFNAKGLAAHAEGWAKALVPVLKASPTADSRHPPRADPN